MKLFDDDILSLPDVFPLLMKPRDVSKDEFIRLVWFLSLGLKDIVERDWIVDICKECGLCESNSDVRRMIKDQSLSIGRRKVNDFNDKVTADDFFDTGIDGLKWTSVRHGKKKAEFILIMEDEGEWFERNIE